VTATRRIAAILIADVAGCSRLMGADQEGTQRMPRRICAELVQTARLPCLHKAGVPKE